MQGTTSFVTALAGELNKRNHEVHIFRVEGIRRSEYRRVEGVHHHVISTDGRMGAPSALVEAMIYYLVETQGVAGRFDVLHAHHRALLPVLDQMRAYGGTRLYLTLHSGAGLASRSEVAKDINWATVGTLNGITASSMDLRDRIRDRLMLSSQWIEVTYPGVDHVKFARWVDRQKAKNQVGLNADDPLILFVGELVQSLGPDLLLEATFEVLQEFPAAKLVYVGDGPMTPYLMERAKVLGIFQNTRFLRFAQEEQIIDLYNACDVVCIPARHGRVDQAVLEAWSAGKATIVSQSAVPEFFEPHVNGLATKGEIAEIAKDILLCLRQKEFAGELGKHAWNRVSSELSWAAIARKCEELYEQKGNGR